MTVNFSDIEAAHQRIKHLIVKTPLLNSPRLDEIAGRKLWIKAEPLQVTGSFKFRGACSAISALTADARERGVLAYSSGNHAQGVALAARLFGTSATIVMPHDAPSNKVANTQALGAEVIRYHRGKESRETIGATVATERRLSLIKPYDDSMVIAGQGTVGIELAHQITEHDVSASAVLCCCGGGGLSAGIATALAVTHPGLSVHTVEPEGFDDTLRSLRLGYRVRNASEQGSICDAIVTPTPGELTFPILKRLAGGGFAVTDQQVLHAMKFAFDTLKLVMEPGGAVALAAALFGAHLPDADELLVIASGGNVDGSTFQKALGIG
jgi:threonine dehydratase